MRRGPPDAQEGDARRPVVVERRGRALDEPHPVVKQVEPGEPVPHDVEVGLEAGDTPFGERRSQLGLGAGPEPVDDPHAGVRHLVGVEVGAHEDGATTPARAALHQVAIDPLAPDRVERRLEVVELGLAHGGIGQERGCGGVVGPGGREPVAFERPIGVLGVAHRVAQCDRVRALLRPLGSEQVQPDLVLQVVPIEQRVLEEREVPGDGTVRPGIAAGSSCCAGRSLPAGAWPRRPPAARTGPRRSRADRAPCRFRAGPRAGPPPRRSPEPK